LAEMLKVWKCENLKVCMVVRAWDGD
jgi:hypothetical protein